MSDGTAAAWAHVFLQALEILGGFGGTIAGFAVLLARRTFVTRDDLAAHLKERDRKFHELEGRLSAGDKRFIALTGAIEMVKLAAEQARDAAGEARAAADSMGEMHVEIADLRGDIKALESALRPIERLTMGMVEGHMAEGRATKPTRNRT